MCTTDCGDPPHDSLTPVGRVLDGGPADSLVGYCDLMCDDRQPCPRGTRCVTTPATTDNGTRITNRFCA
jgi:hypothetical protein